MEKNYDNFVDYEYVDEDIDKDLECAICLSPLLNPVMHNGCGNMFCDKCITKLDKCPLCRKNIDVEAINTNIPRSITNKLNELKIYCPINKQHKIARKDFDIHKIKCGDYKCDTSDYCKYEEQFELLKIEIDQLKLSQSKLHQQYQNIKINIIIAVVALSLIISCVALTLSVINKIKYKDPILNNNIILPHRIINNTCIQLINPDDTYGNPLCLDQYLGINVTWDGAQLLVNTPTQNITSPNLIGPQGISGINGINGINGTNGECGCQNVATQNCYSGLLLLLLISINIL